MALPFKPHTFRIFGQSARLNATNVVEGFAPDTPGILVRGCAQQLSPSVAYDAFGRDVSNGWSFFVDIDMDTLSATEVGGTIEYNGDVYAIEKVQTNNQMLASDHTVIYAVQVKH
jgi:hypothetical protein